MDVHQEFQMSMSLRNSIGIKQQESQTVHPSLPATAEGSDI